MDKENVEYYSAIKKDEILSFTANEVKDTVQQTKPDIEKCCTFPLMGEVKESWAESEIEKGMKVDCI
jgi:hypothetical protein